MQVHLLVTHVALDTGTQLGCQFFPVPLARIGNEAALAARRFIGFLDLPHILRSTTVADGHLLSSSQFPESPRVI